MLMNPNQSDLTPGQAPLPGSDHSQPFPARTSLEPCSTALASTTAAPPAPVTLATAALPVRAYPAQAPSAAAGTNYLSSEAQDHSGAASPTLQQRLRTMITAVPKLLQQACQSPRAFYLDHLERHRLDFWLSAGLSVGVSSLFSFFIAPQIKSPALLSLLTNLSSSGTYWGTIIPQWLAFRDRRYYLTGDGRLNKLGLLTTFVRYGTLYLVNDIIIYQPLRWAVLTGLLKGTAQLLPEASRGLLASGCNIVTAVAMGLVTTGLVLPWLKKKSEDLPPRIERYILKRLLPKGHSRQS